MRPLLSLLLGLACCVGAAPGADAAVRIDWWHAMLGANNDVVEELADEFNASQDLYNVVPVFRGTYPETLQAGLDAYRAGSAPHIIQVFDVGTGVLMSEAVRMWPMASGSTSPSMLAYRTMTVPAMVAIPQLMIENSSPRLKAPR